MVIIPGALPIHFLKNKFLQSLILPAGGQILKISATSALSALNNSG